MNEIETVLPKKRNSTDRNAIFLFKQKYVFDLIQLGFVIGMFISNLVVFSIVIWHPSVLRIVGATIFFLLTLIFLWKWGAKWK